MTENYDNTKNVIEDRDKTIVKASMVGIITNLFLVAFKMVVGLIANSISVILDAINNLSDALSSVITILGAKLAHKAPDKQHPYGYGRIEYLSAMIVAALILYAGITSLVESIKKIIVPEPANYSIVSLVIIAVAIFVKIFLGRYVKDQGEKVNSSALIGSGEDALFDAVLSTSVFVSAIAYFFFKISLEAYVGVIIALFIIKSGIEMMLDTVNDILGQREDAQLSHQIKSIINNEKLVRGAYDLNLFNYGPEKNYATVHIELADTVTVAEVDALTRKLQSQVMEETGIALISVGVYSYNTKDKTVDKMISSIKKKLIEHDWVLQIHGFYVEKKEKRMRFDVVASFDIDHHEAHKILMNEVMEMYPDYSVTIVIDVDATDI